MWVSNYSVIESRIRAIDWRHWMTLTDVTIADARYLCSSWASCYIIALLGTLCTAYVMIAWQLLSRRLRSRYGLIPGVADILECRCVPRGDVCIFTTCVWRMYSVVDVGCCCCRVCVYRPSPRHTCALYANTPAGPSSNGPVMRCTGDRLWCMVCDDAEGRCVHDCECFNSIK